MTRRNAILGRVFAAAGTVLLVLATLIACVQAIAFDRSFYRAEYEKLATAAYVGVDGETLDLATETLLGYLEGSRETLGLPVRIDGAEQEFYTDKEKRHMVDVAALEQNAVRFMAAGYPAGAALVVLAYLLLRQRKPLLRTCFFSIIATLIAFGILAGWAAADFNSFWVSFHRVFFTNDLWMLDPATSRMIRMFEQTFFFDMVARILGWFIGLIAAALVFTGVWGRKSR